MRIDPAGYAVINQLSNRKPRYVVQIAFAGVDNDLWITSHNDCQVPEGTLASKISYNTLSKPSGTSQRIDPIKAYATIGAISYTVLDKDKSISARIKSEYDNFNGLRGRTVRFYIGEEGLEWDDYILVQTQIIQNVSLDKGVYKFSCADIQRTIRKTIFDVNRTTMRSVMDSTQTVVPTYNTASFETLAHGPSYSDLPNETVGYVELEDEIIAWRKKVETAIVHTQSDVSFAGNVISSLLIDFTEFDVGQEIAVSGSGSNDGVYNIHPTTAPTANTLTVVETLVTESAGASVTVFADIQFYNCDRGVLNTKAVIHTMSEPLPTADRRTKIEEYVYLELPIPKLIYALLTGSLYGSADVLPSGWHLNISTDFVATSEFINIGSDYWDTTDDTLGLPSRFIAPKKTSGKSFIEKELLLLGGFFTPILADGQMGLRRMTNILSNASYVRQLDETNIISISPLVHNQEAVHNQFNIEWNYDRKEKRFTRTNIYLDGTSIATHGAADPLTMSFQGLHGSSSTSAMLVVHTDSARDRYAGPPQEITVKCFFLCNDLEVGDIVRLKLQNLEDYVTGGSIDRSFEIQEVKTDWRNGTVSLKLFGSSQAAESVAPTSAAFALTDIFYTSAGTDISTVTTGSGTSKWTITGNSNLTGNADMTNSGAIYYYDGDLEIASGITLTINDNVQLRIKGDITVNGTIDGAYNGIVASSSGTAGGMGNTQPPGSILVRMEALDRMRVTSTARPLVQGNWSSVPRLGLISTGATLNGLPSDLRGSSGGTGGGAYMDVIGGGNDRSASGTAGGAGGAGLLIVTRNLFTGGSGAINLHGEDGVISTGSARNSLGEGVAYPSSGGGGAPGGLLIIVDGVGTVDTSTVSQYYGVTTIRYNTGPNANYTTNYPDNWASHYQGIGSWDTNNYVNISSDFTRVQYLDPVEAAVIDTPDETTVASAITLQEVSAVNTTLNQTAIEVSVSAPVGSGPYIDNYKSSHISARKSVGDSWIDIGEVGPVGELSFLVVADGSTWEVKAHAVSLAGVESEDYISDTITVTTQLETVIGTGNKIVTEPEPETNGGVALDETGIVAYDGTGTAKVTIDAATGTITAVDGDFSGTISATAGVIGGWDISADAIEYGTAATHMELNPTTGIWFGADTFLTAPFSVVGGGYLTSKAGKIGGWTIDSTKLESPNTRVILDSTNNRIQVQDATGTNYTRMDADGITGVDSVLGTVFRLPTDGTAPSFSSGIINSTVFNITSAGILETSSTVGDGSASGQGVRINDTGIKGYKINNATPVFTLDATDGSLTCTDATLTNASVSGVITVGAGSSGVANLSDAGDLATGDRVDLLYDDGATVGATWDTDVTGQPANSEIFNFNLINEFENDDIDFWTEVGSDTVTQDVDNFSGTYAGLFTSVDAAPPSSGATGSVYITIPTSTALALAGRRAKITVYAKQPASSAAAEFAVAYSTNEVGNSGWFTFTPTTSWVPYTFFYDVPVPLLGGTDYVGIWGDTLGTGLGVLIDNVTIEADDTTASIEEGTTITGGGITLSAGGNIKGGQTAYATGTGFFLGYDTDYKFSIGSATDYLTWDGSTLAVNGTLTVGSTNLTETNTLNVNTTQTDVGLSLVDNQSAATIQAGTTASNVGLGSVSNLNPAGMTDSGLTTGVTINGGGITMSSGGAIKSYLKDSFTDTTAGFYLGYDTTGTAGYKLNIGDANAFMKYDATSGLQVQTGSTTTKGIEMNPGGDNEFHFYGALDQAGTTVAEIIRLGIGETPNWYIAEFGSTNLACDKIALHAESYSGRGMDAYSYTGMGVYALSETNIASYGKSGSGTGGYFKAVSADDIGCYGICSASTGTGKGVYGYCTSSSGWDFYAAGAGTNYGPFTGSHDGLVINGTTYDIGDIIVDGSKIFTRNISNTIFENSLSTSANQKGIIGVVATEMSALRENEPYDEATDVDDAKPANVRPSALTDMPDVDYATLMTTHKLITFNAVGEGQINVCGENGDLEIGDLIVTSSMAGKGMKQADDIVRGYTVAKVREDVTFATPDEVKMVACIYLCG